MNSLSIKLGVILIGLVIFASAGVWGEDWKPFDFNHEAIKYYDAEGITYPSKKYCQGMGESGIYRRRPSSDDPETW